MEEHHFLLPPNRLGVVILMGNVTNVPAYYSIRVPTPTFQTMVDELLYRGQLGMAAKVQSVYCSSIMPTLTSETTIKEHRSLGPLLAHTPASHPYACYWSIVQISTPQCMTMVQVCFQMRSKTTSTRLSHIAPSKCLER